MKTPSAPIKLIVGLGNPGSDYTNTRHNAGQDWLESLAHKYAQPLAATPKFFGYSARIIIENKDVRLLIPTTYMNRSGQAVASLCQFYKIEPENILVAHDELDLDPGTAKLKIGGGHGGHNGLRDIISALGNNKNFGRLRLGIGHPGNAKQVANFVLKRAPQAEYEATTAAANVALANVPDLILGDWEKAMRELHSKAN